MRFHCIPKYSTVEGGGGGGGLTRAKFELRMKIVITKRGNLGILVCVYAD